MNTLGNRSMCEYNQVWCDECWLEPSRLGRMHLLPCTV